ncbi:MULTISPECIES: ABC transporter ATP-binding protein [Cytobacillus]|uniref:ABC transporter ATP-binding protein n=1 Tax=Cytobacillus TaxID=2675230 RepID=UPI0020412916|nr:ABC transporter ATP-binding protein [Cytobacillus firmus]MCM3706271.1 ABC transporter ATP-binding protein [Cytobacillus firmus]
MPTQIKFNDVTKKYGDTTVIDQLSLHIEEGELFTLLGPSGCGKTTLLRMIAGFHSVDGGTISFNEQVINDIPVNKRDIGMVFQSYAIFPHMTVKDNVKYGLNARKLPKEEKERRLEEILETVQISQYRDRLPARLSGGQQQRVALARAIVIHPKVLLMDEPLSNLDAKLRVDMRRAINEIQKEIGITTVYVTHDQEEALAISDRIAVMNKGEIQQVGSPTDIYLRPANQFVATFIGHSNLFSGKVSQKDGKNLITLSDGYRFEISTLQRDIVDGMDVTVAVRPEEFIISETDKGIEGVVLLRNFLGKYIHYEVQLPNGSKVELSQDTNTSKHFFEVNQSIKLDVMVDKINVFTSDGEQSLIEGVKRYE